MPYTDDQERSLREQIRSLSAPVRAIVVAARRAVKAAVPGAVEVECRAATPRSKSMMWKLCRYGRPGESGYVLAVGVFAEHASMFFARGVDLEDGSGILEGAGKQLRYVTLRTPADAENAALARLVRRAFRLGTSVERSVDSRMRDALAWLEARATKAVRDGMARYGIPSEKALGVAMKDIKALGKSLGRDHALALALWDSGGYEARMLTAFVADPGALSAVQMDRWCKDFDNWALCDTLCFHLFDRSPHAWAKVDAWSRRHGEFEKRSAFALLWSLALHDKKANDARFRRGLELVEGAAGDDRNFVKKAVSMALRAIAKRNAVLKKAALATANRLSNAEKATATGAARRARPRPR